MNPRPASIPTAIADSGPNRIEDGTTVSAVGPNGLLLNLSTVPYHLLPKHLQGVQQQRYLHQLLLKKLNRPQGNQVAK